MLERIFVQNILFIDEIDIDLKSGLSVITGETGSGKSILLECIKCALGDKIPVNFSSKSRSNSNIFLEFNVENNKQVKEFLDQNLIGYEDNILSIRRTFNDDKKSKFFLNNVPSNLSLVKEIAGFLLEYQGQHSQTLLLDAKYHQQILDLYGNFEDEMSDISKQYKILKNEILELKKLEEEQALKDRDRDYLTTSFNELIEIDPGADELEILAEKRKQLLDNKKSIDTVKTAISFITDNKVESSLIGAYKAISKIEDASFSSVLEILDRVIIETNEILESLNSKLSGNDKETCLEEIEERFFLIKEVARKYKIAPNELVSYLASISEKLDRINNLDHITELTKKRIDALKKDYQNKATLLSNKRKDLALKLEQNLKNELISLKLDKTTFKIDIKSDLEKISPTGIDSIEFLVTTNPDIPLGALKDVSSGGELSRFMLAIRVVLSKLKSPPTIIFDEIDTGLGGSVADAVGDKLAALGKFYQLLVITHHPQVAAKADFHYLISKNFFDGETSMSIDLLSEQGQKEELARMLSGKEVTSAARIAAEKLLN